jgi:peptidoglycan/xylan/chitin deacetylase (PgdA/CDA1 family)
MAVALRSRLREAAYRLVPSGRLLRRGPAGHRRVALTFDDGPDHHTEGYLDVLDHYRVAATFFIMGDLSELRPDLVREYLRRGHQIGSHGYDHHKFTELTTRALAAQLRATEHAIGPQPAGKWVRPPHGALGLRTIAQLLANDYVIAMWSFDSMDYGLKDADATAERCAPSAVAPGEVMLFHEGMPSTLAALPRIIEGLFGAGYECVTMADLFAP